MAPEHLIFDIGSKIFEITDLFAIKQIGKFNCIQSERFTVGGYGWVIEFYPHGINELVPKDMASVSVRVLNTIEEFQATCFLSVWHWPTSRWLAHSQSQLVTFSSSGSKACYHWTYDNFVTLSVSPIRYVKDEMVRVKCVLCVTPRPPVPAPPLKPDVDKHPACTNNQGNPSGADSSFDNGFHTADYSPPNGSNNTKLPRQPTVRIYCEANKDLSLTIRNGTVVLAPANSNDYYQHWIKDMSYGDKVKDASGLPAFALVNRVTGEALKNPAGAYQEVSLVPYFTNRLEDSVKWIEVRSTGFCAIRIAGRTSLNLTAVISDDDDDTNFSDGSEIVVCYWIDEAIQKWKIVPYNSNVPY